MSQRVASYEVALGHRDDMVGQYRHDAARHESEDCKPYVALDRGFVEATSRVEELDPKFEIQDGSPCGSTGR